MSSPTFSYEKAVQYGWDTTKRNFWFFVLIIVLAMGIPFLVEEIFNLIPAFSQSWTVNLKDLIGYGFDFPVTSLTVSGIIAWVVQRLLEMGIIKVSLDFVEKQKSELNRLFSAYPKLLHIILGTILYGLIVTIGLILFIVPGIIWAVKYQFYGYFIVNEDLDALSALKQSAIITKPSLWNLFIFNVFMGLLVLLGFLAFIIGAFWALPTTWVAHAHAYGQLRGKS